MSTNDGRLSPEHHDDVQVLALAARDAAKRATAAEHSRDEAIRSAAATGMPVRDLVVATGLSRARIYQILDRRG